MPITFDRAKLWLRKHFPGSIPVTVRLATREAIKERYEALHGPRRGQYDALTIIDGDTAHATILLFHGLTLSQKIEALWHEWSHYLRWHVPEDCSYQDHDDLFWSYYGRIYRKWHDDE